MNKKIEDSFFWKMVIDNKFVASLFTVLLLSLTLFVFTKIAYIFAPIAKIFSIIGTPIIFAVLFYYLFLPIVTYIEDKGLSRKTSVIIVLLGVIALIAIAITFVIPGIRDQFKELVNNFPKIWKTVSNQANQLLEDAWLTEVYKEVQETQVLSKISEQIANGFSVTLNSITSAFGTISKIILTVLTMPFILYYLLTDGDRFKKTVLKYIPTKGRPVFKKFISQSGELVGSYVRGQLLVALAVTAIFYAGYTIIGLEYALVLSITAGILNLIPYLGSIVSIIPAMIVGAFVSPFKLLQVIIILMVEQFIEGRFVSPQILGNSLDIHPLIILFILLVSGSLFGFLGLVFGVPGFAILRVVWNLSFDWIKSNYDYYDE